MSRMTQSGAEGVREVLTRIAAAMGLEATIEIEETEDAVNARFSGDDLGALIGHHGAVIDAVQHLAYRVAYPGGGERKQVTVDAGGYRERRAAALRSAADQAAEAAIRQGRPVALDPMGALERKVVHEHLKSRHDVETYSEGQEPSRRLVVAPVVG